MNADAPLPESKLPPEAAALGTLERTCVSRSKLARTFLGPVLSEWLLGAAWVSLVLTVLFGSLVTYHWAKSTPQIRLVNSGVVLFVACLAGGLFAVRHGKQPNEFAYLLYTTGFAYFEDGNWSVVRWDEVADILSPLGWGGDATLVLRDGRMVPVRTGVSGQREYQGAIESQVVKRVYRRSRQALAAGQSVQFGPLGIGPDGLNHDGQTLAWSDLERLAVSINVPYEVSGVPIRFDRAGERLWIVQAGGRWWCDLRFREVPTRTVLIQLIRERCPSAFTDFTLAHFDDAD